MCRNDYPVRQEVRAVALDGLAMGQLLHYDGHTTNEDQLDSLPGTAKEMSH